MSPSAAGDAEEWRALREQLEAVDEHTCDGGFLGEDSAGLPIVCPRCRGPRLARGRRRLREALDGPAEGR